MRILKHSRANVRFWKGEGRVRAAIATISTQSTITPPMTQPTAPTAAAPKLLIPNSTLAPAALLALVLALAAAEVAGAELAAAEVVAAADPEGEVVATAAAAEEERDEPMDMRAEEPSEEVAEAREAVSIEVDIVAEAMVWVTEPDVTDRPAQSADWREEAACWSAVVQLLRVAMSAGPGRDRRGKRKARGEEMEKGDG